jgi:hypothetical protein
MALWVFEKSFLLFVEKENCFKNPYASPSHPSPEGEGGQVSNMNVAFVKHMNS